MDDLEEDYKIEKNEKIKKSLMSLLLSLVINFPLIYSLNEKFKVIFKYFNINL